MRLFKKIVMVIAVVAVFGSGVFATKAFAASQNEPTNTVHSSLTSAYTAVVQKQAEPLK